MLTLDEVRKSVQLAKGKFKQFKEKAADTCTNPIWIQFKEHKAVFEIIKKKMRGYGYYYKTYKDALHMLELAAHDPDSEPNVGKYYAAIWEIIFDFFGSKEYLASYNPIFLQTKNRKERDEMLGKLFDIKPIDIEKEFYEIMLHLLLKQILEEKFEHLKKLQKISRIKRKWKEFRKRKATVTIV